MPENEDDYAFDSLTSEIDQDNGVAAEQEKELSDIEKINKRLDDKDAHIAKIEEENARMRDQMELGRDDANTMSRMKEVFNPAPQGVSREEEIRKFDADPITGMNSAIEEKLAGITQRMDKNDRSAMAERAMSSIDRDYDVDWDKDAGKIKAQMEIMSSDYKAANPQQAIFQAARLAGVIKKKEKLPEFAIGGQMTPKMQEKYVKTRQDDFDASMNRGKSHEEPDILSKLNRELGF